MTQVVLGIGYNRPGFHGYLGIIGYENAMARNKQPARSWKDIRAALNKAGRNDLLKLVGDLYALRKENQDFLHARFLKDASTLVPYKVTIEHYISPAEPWKTPVKISLARKAISDYRKAIGDPEGLAELMLFYVECGVNFTLEFGDIDEAFYSSVISVFSDGMKMLDRCDQDVIDKLLPRFEAAVHSTAEIGWGFYDSLRDTFEAYRPDA